MRAFIVAASCVLTMGSVAAQNYVTFREDHAQKLFNESRNAIGGEAAVARIETLLLKGTVNLRAEDGGPGSRDLEIRIMMPDRYVRIERAGPFERRLGFVDNKVIAGIRDGGDVENPPPQMHETLLRSERSRFARFLLGFSSSVTPVQWLTIATSRSVGRMTDPRTGPTGVISDDPDRFRRTLEVVGEPAFYTRVSYNGTNVPVRMEYPPSKGKTAVVELLDRRRAGGLLLPFRIVTKINDKIVEEMIFDEILVNPPLTLEDFVR